MRRRFEGDAAVTIIRIRIIFKREKYESGLQSKVPIEHLSMIDVIAKTFLMNKFYFYFYHKRISVDENSTLNAPIDFSTRPKLALVLHSHRSVPTLCGAALARQLLNNFPHCMNVSPIYVNVAWCANAT